VCRARSPSRAAQPSRLPRGWRGAGAPRAVGQEKVAGMGFLPAGLLWQEEPAVLPANHAAASQHPSPQAASVLVSHVYYLFQLFLPYESNKKGQQCYFTPFASSMLKLSSLQLSWPAVIGSVQNSYLTGSQELSPGD